MSSTISTVKMLDAASGRIGGYLVVWGDPQARDLEGEYFTPETELGLNWYDRRPVLYHHGLDGEIKAAAIGVIDTLQPDDTGIWAEAQLDLRQRYVGAVQRLVDKGLLNWSSGSLPHLVDVAADGHIRRWPLVEGSLTPTPAEPRRTDVQTLKSACKALGLDSGWIEQHPSSDEHKGAAMDTAQDNAPRKRLPIAEPGDALKAAPISVSSPFDSLNADDMLYGYMILRARKNFQGVSDRYANALAYKTRKAGLMAAKTDADLSHSLYAGFGDEWVPDLWSGQIWQRARQDNVVLPLFRAIEMPSNPFELPIEGTDPTVHYVQETTMESQLTLGAGNRIPSSKIGSGKVTLAAKKLALRVGFSSELVEDAIVPVLSIYREQAMRALTSAIDEVLLNGDATTASTGNINSDDAAPASDAAYLAFDGLRHLPLVDNTAQATTPASSALALSDLRATRFLMPPRYAARPNDLAWIVDGGTYARLLGLSEFLTMDKAGPMATAQTGQIGLMDGAPVFVSAAMPQSQAGDGFVGAGPNSSGTALCVYRPGWYVGYRRRVAVNVDYLPYYDSYQLTATVRLGFARFDDAVASALYGITI